MDLKYIWIKKFRNIEQQGFSFTDKYIISYNSLSKELSITPNENALPPGFYANNIVSLTGIIGENGAGKSNILDFIMTRLSTLENGTSVSYGDEDVYVVILDSFIFKHSTLQFTNTSELQQLGFSVIEFDRTLLDLNNKRSGSFEIISKIYSTKYLFYASAFDRQSSVNSNNLIDISTSYWISQSLNRYDDFPAGYYNREVFNQTNILLDFNQLVMFQLPFNPPEHLHIEVESFGEVIRKIDLQAGFFETLELKELGYLSNELSIYHNYFLGFEDGDIDQLIKLFSLNLLLIKLKQYPDIFKNVKSNIFSDLLNGNLVENENLDPKLIDFYNNLNKIKKLLYFAHSNGYISIIEPSPEPGNPKIYKHFSFEINSASKRYFYRFLFLYSQLTKHTDFLKRYWEGLSSGQQAYLNLYSRFYEAMRRIQELELLDTYFRGDHLTIIIDEGETYYHPQWQKEFTKQVIDYVSRILFDRKLQIILASNSPFIASDIPSSCLNFIKRDEDGKCKVDKKIRRNNTFAANIHTLLTDSFFLKGGLMGDFAKNKVNSLIEYLNAPNQVTEEPGAILESAKVKSEMKKLIQIIGEPVIRHKLEEIWIEKFGPEEEVAILQKRLEEAQSRLNRRNDSD